MSLAHFMPLASFYTLWKHQKTFSDLTFSGEIEMDIGRKWVINVYLHMGQGIQEWAKQSFGKIAFKKFEVIWSA